MVRNEFRYPSSDGHTALHAVEWLPNGVARFSSAARFHGVERIPIGKENHKDGKPPRSVLQIAHGIAEHVLRYERFAAYLTDRGFAVVGNDHLGHGYSVSESGYAVSESGYAMPESGYAVLEGGHIVPEAGTRLYMGPRGGWFRAVDDMETLRRWTAEKFPGVPYFLLGHSMGSFLARTFLIRYPGAVDAAILCGTAQPSRLLLAAGQLVVEEECLRLGETRPSALAARLAFGAYDRPFAPNRTSRDWLSVNQANVDAFLSSPLCRGTPTAGLLREMLSGMRYNSAAKNLRRMNPDTPILFVSGAEDPVGDMGAGVRRAAALFRRAGARDVTVRLFHGLRHEILNEASPDRERVMGEMVRWIEGKSAF